MRFPHAFLVDTGWLALKESLDACGRVGDEKSGGSPVKIPVGCPGSPLCECVGSVAAASSCGLPGRRNCRNQRLCG